LRAAGALARSLQWARAMRIAAFLVLLLAGCLEPREGIILVDERFEDPLDEWVLSGDAEITTTYHPGEHALRFDGPTTRQRGINVALWDEFQDGNWIEYTSDCDEAPTVRVAQRPDLTWEITLELPTAFDREGWERIYTTVPPIVREQYTYSQYSLFTVVADGGCFIDNLRLVQPEPDSGW
jgi:hypothetical protein